MIKRLLNKWFGFKPKYRIKYRVNSKYDSKTIYLAKRYNSIRLCGYEYWWTHDPTNALTLRSREIELIMFLKHNEYSVERIN